MEKLQIYSNTSVEWRPSPVVALAASADGSRLAAAREDGSLEIWLVSPGAVGWHCQLTVQGNPSARVSSLVWFRSRTGSGPGRLLSSSIDGSISEWDLFSLQQKVAIDSVGVSIWQMAIEPFDDLLRGEKNDYQRLANGHADYESQSDCESSYSDNDEYPCDANVACIVNDDLRLAIACDDGCIRIYNTSDTDGVTYSRSFPRVSGRILSVVWSLNGKQIFSGSSDGLIRCWDTSSFHEMYRITIGLGGLGSGPELCVWSLLFLRCGTLVSGDSTGSVQFWDSRHGTLLQAHTYHKGDVNALATIPSHRRVFSAGSDGKVILYKMSNGAIPSGKDDLSSDNVNKWVYVDSRNAHTHDVRALAVTMPISEEDTLPDEKLPKLRCRQRPLAFTYHKWARLGVPMLISAGDDAKLFAYSAQEFTQFSPHDICPAPQRASLQLVASTIVDGASMILAQYSGWLDVMLVKLGHHKALNSPIAKSTTTQLLARIKSKASRKIISSTASSSGLLFAYSDHVRPCLFELLRHKKSGWSVNKLQLPRGLQYAHCMIFSVDSSYLMLAGHDRKIYVVDVKKSELVHSFVGRRKDGDTSNQPSEPPITKMFTSSDGQWLAAVNCFGDIYIFNLETYRQHWFISRLNGASVTAAGFPPKNNNVLVIITSSNQVYVFDVEAKQLGEWSRRHSLHLPRTFQEFPGEVIGLSFPPINSTSVVVYSARAMCLIDFGMAVGQDDEDGLPNCPGTSLSKFDSPETATGKRKRKGIDEECKKLKKKNFDFFPFMSPVLFVGHISQNSLLVVEKRWMEVVQNFDAPVHKHMYGT
ncbi:U3 small nucleolar RNA-associated protein 4-like protein [Iris pallida]|uniref:U3 small nucleolar RNA-associated protein 4-like protein n=1 Tax=Iris pallida TaxID=29817 RepID=A0AAX6E6X1_IRIPA|nr:U3 small nucleolar RNA-associated protein 4-like protein [Iris pallida]KAJ6817836.1 U3 small nucleolar RNA-associated protein 4-like protein [Iris pallida]